MSDDEVDGGLLWRELYETVMDTAHEHDDVRPVLERWLREHPRHVAEVREAGRPEHHRTRFTAPRGDYTTSERLYAMSRVIDHLLLNHQPAPDDPTVARHHDPRFPARDALPVFCHGLGADPIGERPFHPFFHEIVEVEQADDPDEPPTVVEERWPGYLMDAMVLLRTGVAVRAGSRWLVRGVADRSAIYWTFRRRARLADDMSKGWGSSSQWATDFRRDYLVDGRLHHNVDAALRPVTPGPPYEGPEPAALTEVVRHRCSTVVDHGDDVHPYDAHHVEPAPDAAGSTHPRPPGTLSRWIDGTPRGYADPHGRSGSSLP